MGLETSCTAAGPKIGGASGAGDSWDTASASWDTTEYRVRACWQRVTDTEAAAETPPPTAMAAPTSAESAATI